MSIPFDQRQPTTANGRVSVVIPCYNRAVELPRAVASVLAQTLAERCDIVVVDDGSTDDTANVVREQRTKIHFVQQDNAGAAVARNTGIWALPNEFVAFLDSDDVWEPKTIEWHLSALAANPNAGFSVGQSRTRFPDGRVITEMPPPVPMNEAVDLLPSLIEANHIPTPSIMVRRTWLEDVRGFTPELRRVQDYDLWLRLAARGPGVLFPHVVFTYMTDTPESLQKNRRASLHAAAHVRRRAKALLKQRPDCREAWKRGNAKQYALMRDEAYRHGRYLEASRWGIASLWSQPRGRARWEWGKVFHAGQLALWRMLGKRVEVRP